MKKIMRSRKSGTSHIKSNLWMMGFAALTLVLCLAHSFHIQGRLASKSAINSPIVIDCEGDACSQVSLIWDDAKQQYKAHNSSNNWVRVSAANLASNTSICVAPSNDAYLVLKSVVSPYHANFNAACAPPAPTNE